MHIRQASKLALAFIGFVVVAAVAIPAARSGVTPHLRLSGQDGAHVRAPNTDLGSGDLEIVFFASADDWSRGTQTVLAKWPGSKSKNALRVQFSKGGHLQLIVKDALKREYLYSAYTDALGIRDGRGYWFRLRFDASKARGKASSMKAWVSKDDPAKSPSSVNWGSEVSQDTLGRAVKSLNDASGEWTVGARNDGSVEAFRGEIWYVHLYRNGTAANGQKTLMLNFRNPKNGYATNRAYDTWANGGVKMAWRIKGSRWAYVGVEETPETPPQPPTPPPPPQPPTPPPTPPPTTPPSPPPTNPPPPPPDPPGDDEPRRQPLLQSPNTAGAMDISPDGSRIVVQQTAAGGPRASLFHHRAGYGSWAAKFGAEPQPTLPQVIETHDGENVAFAPDMSKVYVAGEGSAGTPASTVYSYDLRFDGDEVATPDGPKSQREYDAGALANVLDGLSGMWVSRANPGIHWFVIDHDARHPSGLMLFAIDSVNDRLVWQGRFEESGAPGAISSWADVEDLTGYQAGGGVWYLEIWDNGSDKVYRFREPSVRVGQSLDTEWGLRPDRIIEVVGGAVGSGNIEAMAYNAAEDAMYWIGPRGSIHSMDNNRREVRKVTGWSGRASGRHTASYVGPVVNRPR